MYRLCECNQNCRAKIKTNRSRRIREETSKLVKRTVITPTAPTNSAGGPAGTLQGIFPVTPTPPVVATPPVPVIFTVNPTTGVGGDLQVIALNSAVGVGSYQIDPWDCATVAFAERLQARLNTLLGLNCTIVYGYPESYAQFTGTFAQAGMVPYAQFPLNSDGSLPNPNAEEYNSDQTGAINNFGGLALEYYTAGATIDGNARADALMVEWFKPTH